MTSIIHSETKVIKTDIKNKHPFTGRLVSSIAEKLIQNNLLIPDEVYLQKFLNTVVSAIDEVIEEVKQEKNDGQPN